MGTFVHPYTNTGHSCTELREYINTESIMTRKINGGGLYNGVFQC